MVFVTADRTGTYKEVEARFLLVLPLVKMNMARIRLLKLGVERPVKELL